jgi:polygalacturonase
MKIIFITAGMFFFPCFSAVLHQQASDSTGWDRVPIILQSIIPPQFPAKDFLLTSSGAVGDGTTDCTNAFATAIDSCSKSGGGRVVVPAGTYLAGAIHLQSDVNLYVALGATIKFSIDPLKYLPVVYTRFESVECMNYLPLIYAFEQTNIAITVEGTLDGQATSSNWWAWKSLSSADTTLLNSMVADSIPVEQRIFGSSHYLRPNFFQPYRCTNILVQGVSFKDSPMWGINPVLCRNVSVLNVTVTANSGDSRPNTDGCDPECCTNVLIRGCSFSTGDDCIAIKSGRNADGRRINIPCSNVIIQNCIMKDGHGGVTIGSETSGGINNVFAENDTMNSANLQYALRFKTNTLRGGMIENIYERNISVLTLSKYIIYIDCNYGGETGSFIPVVRNLYFDSLVCTQAPNALYMVGLAASPLNNVVLSNCTFMNIKSSSNTISNIIDLQFNNVTINGNILTSADEKSGQNELPGQFLLRQNYPNPFNPSTKINYQLPEASHVTLRIYDIMGREVAVLVDGNKGAGYYTAVFDGARLASGVYFTRLIVQPQDSKQFVKVKKMLLIK